MKNNEVEEEENKNGISADLIRGHINTIILRTLYERDKYGYEIIEEIESKSHGQYTLKQPTLYSALKRLESQGYINAYWKTDEVSNGGRRKYYTLTDSGREITERNQAEWEYSRTVIDSLISERNFDFSQPAPSAVDFKILKTSTSRVPTSKDDEDEVKEVREVKYDDENDKKDEKPEEIVVVEQPVAQPVQELSQPTQSTEQQATTQQVQVQEVVQQIMQEVLQQMQSVQQPVQPVQEFVNQTQTQPEPTTVQIQSNEAVVTDSVSDARRIHENYLRLISEPVVEQRETPTVPDSEYIDTDKLIYNNKPETERDYKNLINNLFVKTVKQHNRPAEQSNPIQQVPVQVNYEDASAKASKDGLTVNSSEYTVSGSRRKKYNRGKTLFKCSLIVGVILLFEFALSLAFKDSLGINGISIGYPFVILAIAVAQLAIFGILTTTDFGKCTRKPTSHSYLTASVVITVLLILIVFVTSILLNVRFDHAGDIAAKIIIPCLVVLNIPIFSTIFYVFSK
ncbi:MAG: PadR family transcriptional regulator [Clostridia bacterium]|nr:PadR family transcriptional regulator [Clostridia bacterium]